MELFGYVCSALCKRKAEDLQIALPVYEQQKSVATARQWRKAGRVAAAITVTAMVLIGVWTWYAWFGSVPSPIFSKRFAAAAYSGQCRLYAQDQVVFLHGGTLTRVDRKSGNEIWSQQLIDKQRISNGAAAAFEQMKITRQKAISNGASPSDWVLPTLTELIDYAERAAAAALQLHGRADQVWISSPGKLVRYDWQTGKASQEVPKNEFTHRLVAGQDELLLISEKGGLKSAITHVNLASGELRTEEVAAPTPPKVAAAGPGNPARPGNLPGAAPSAGARSDPSATAARSGVNTGQPAGGRPLDPAAVANQAQNLPMATRLALPAILAANANQQRLLAEMRDQPPATAAGPIGTAALPGHSILRAGSGFVRFSVRLLESRIVERQAMKEPPKKSALEGEVNRAATTAIANEILNEMQRDRTGGVVREDVSRYQVTLSHVGATTPAEWTGEVIGRPELFPLETVDVLVAGKSLLVFDKSARKRWESKLNFNVSHGFRDESDETAAPFGQGPCVERGATLYVFDQGVLTAFELATGNARWRLPSVGVAGLFFDDQGKVYVNTTTAGPESIKYSSQIDISERVKNAVLKLDAGTGKTLWTTEQQGMVRYVSGKFVYTLETYAGDEDDNPMSVKTGFEIPPHIRIKRLDPGNGRVLWEHYQRRAPLDYQFEKNKILLLFKKELQVLKFVAL